MQSTYRSRVWSWLPYLAVAGVLVFLLAPSLIQSQPKTDGDKQKKDVGKTSYDQIAPVILGQETFNTVLARDKANKDEIMARQKRLLEDRYDLTKKVHDKMQMSRGKPIPVGPTARLPAGTTFDDLAKMDPQEVREKGLFPKGYLPLPHPNHPVGGMIFPQHEIKQLPSPDYSSTFPGGKDFAVRLRILTKRRALSAPPPYPLERIGLAKHYEVEGGGEEVIEASRWHTRWK